MSGSRYTIEVAVSGGAAGEFDSISSSLSNLNKQLASLEGFGKDAQGSLDKLAKGSAAQSLDALAASTERVGASFSNMSRSLIADTANMTQAIMGDAVVFQDMKSSLKFAFGEDQWENVFEKVKKEGTKLTFTLSEVGNLASSLGRMDINPFGTMEENLSIFESRSGNMISALEVLQDTADAVGKNTGDLTYPLREAFAGQWKSLESRFDIPKATTKEWKEEMKGMETTQEQYNYLIAQLAKMFGGAGLAQARNYSKAIAQIPDFFEQIRAAIGENGLKIITEGVFDLVDSLQNVISNGKGLSALAGGFDLIAEAIAGGARLAGRLAEGVTEIVAKYPWLPRVAVATMGITIALTAATGAAFTLGSGLISVAATVARLVQVGISLKAVAIGFGTVSAGILVAGALLGGLVTLVTAFGTAINQNIAGAGDAFGKLGSLFTGMGQGLSVFWDTLVSGFNQIGELLGPEITATIDQLYATLMAIGEALGIIGEGESGTSAWAGAANFLVSALVTVASWILQAVQFGLQIIEVAAGWSFLGSVVNMVGSAIGIIISLFQILAPIGKLAFTVIGAAAQILMPILSAVGAVLEFLMSALEAIAGAIVSVGKAIGLIGDKSESASKGVQKLTKAGGVSSSPTFGDWGLGDRTSPFGSSTPYKDKYSVYSLGGGPEQKGEVTAASHVLPPTNYGMPPVAGGSGNEEVVSAVNGVKDAVASLAKTEQPPIALTVMLDGKQIAAATTGNDETRMG